MAVHAHPDDEAISTGGILARYSAEGVRTVLVTCTNGELGDAPGGIKPGEPGTTKRSWCRCAAASSRRAARSSGVTNLELLGYHDSGMEGWAQNDAPDAFWHTPVTDAGSRLAALMRAFEPQVVVTYDENGFYGHPDHIQANRVTHAALEECGIPAKLYYTAMARSRLHGFARADGRGRRGGPRRGAGEPRLRDARRADHVDGRLQRLAARKSTPRSPRTPARATTSSSCRWARSSLGSIMG